MYVHTSPASRNADHAGLISSSEVVRSIDKRRPPSIDGRRQPDAFTLISRELAARSLRQAGEVE